MNPEQLLTHKKQLLRYYEDELSFLRQRALEFADRYKGRADALGLCEGQATDPHVERLLEGVAFLAIITAAITSTFVQRASQLRSPDEGTEERSLNARFDELEARLERIEESLRRAPPQ